MLPQLRRRPRLRHHHRHRGGRKSLGEAEKAERPLQGPKPYFVPQNLQNPKPKTLNPKNSSTLKTLDPQKPELVAAMQLDSRQMCCALSSLCRQAALAVLPSELLRIRVMAPKLILTDSKKSRRATVPEVGTIMKRGVRGQRSLSSREAAKGKMREGAAMTRCSNIEA